MSRRPAEARFCHAVLGVCCVGGGREEAKDVVFFHNIVFLDNMRQQQNKQPQKTTWDH